MTKGREEIFLEKEDIIEAIKAVKSERGKLVQKYVADKLGVSYPTYLKEKQRLELDPKSICLTPRIDSLEAKDFTELEFDEFIGKLEAKKEPMSYETFKYKFDESIILKPIADTHLGSTTTLYQQLWDCLKLCKKTSNVKTVWLGDYIDNFTKFSPGSAVYEQLLPPQQQKMKMEWMIKYLGADKILGFIQGCHDEWSYKNDTFELGKYLANKIGVPYLGFGAVLELEVGENTYKVYVSHDDRYFSKYNLCHGLKREWREETEFDIGISAHRHRTNIEIFAEKGRTVKTMKVSGFKGRDRFLKQNKKERHVFRNEAIIFLAEEVESIDLGIVMFEDIRHALRFL